MKFLSLRGSMLNMGFRNAVGEWLKAFAEKRAYNSLVNSPEIKKLLGEYSPSTGCNYVDYWYIYAFIRKNKPRYVLELGSAVSTVLIGLALKENNEGELVSMEESEYYAKETENRIPENMRRIVKVVVSPSVDVHYGPFHGKKYSEIPNKPYDFVFVDGPHYDAEHSFDLDVIELAQRSEHPFSALIDTRTGSCFIYNLVFGKCFSYNYLLKQGYLTSVSRKNVQSYKQIVRTAMAQHAFPRSFFFP